MRTAEQWRKQYSGEKLNKVSSRLRWSDGSLIKAIQLDAVKQGMQDAADIVEEYHAAIVTETTRKLIARTILIARDSKV